MTIGEQYALEGRREGHREGQAEAAYQIARNLLAQGVHENIVSAATHLSKEELKKLVTETVC